MPPTIGIPNRSVIHHWAKICRTPPARPWLKGSITPCRSASTIRNGQSQDVWGDTRKSVPLPVFVRFRPPPRRCVWPHPYLVTLMSTKPLLRFVLKNILVMAAIYTQYSTYCIVVLIPRLYQFCRNFGKLNIRIMGAIINLFRQIGTLSPWLFQSRLSDILNI